MDDNEETQIDNLLADLDVDFDQLAEFDTDTVKTRPGFEDFLAKAIDLPVVGIERPPARMTAQEQSQARAAVLRKLAAEAPALSGEAPERAQVAEAPAAATNMRAVFPLQAYARRWRVQRSMPSKLGDASLVHMHTPSQPPMISVKLFTFLGYYSVFLGVVFGLLAVLYCLWLLPFALIFEVFAPVFFMAKANRQ